MQVFAPLRLTLSALALALLCSGSAFANEAKSANALPAMRWDSAAKAAEWTAEALAQVAEHDAELTNLIPKDIEVYCPGYAQASTEDRRAFWVAIISATAKYESGFNAKALGLNGRYVGLMQISLATARHSGCEATTTASLKDGKANLSCAIEIIAPRVAATTANALVR
jgi:soluble lytic murein transglycosylase-like protein